MRALLLIPALLLATPALAQDCAADARAAMLDTAHPVPMRQDVTTAMAGQEMRNTVLSRPDRRGMTMDDKGNPASLWIGGRFYTSGDAGKSWSLISEQTAEQLAAQDANRAAEAAAATGFDCQYGIDLDGKTVNRLTLSSVMTGSGTPVTSTYWVDAGNRFPWKVVHEFGGKDPMTITQVNAPDPAIEIADPAG